MARQKSDNPRTEQLLLRLTARQMEMLESIAHLARATPNHYAHQLLVNHLAALSKDPHVQRDLANRASFDATSASTTPLDSKRRAKADD